MIISSILSIIIITKYFKYHSWEFLLVGIAIFGLAGPWFPDSITFILILFTGANYDATIYLNFTIVVNVVVTALTPISIISWLTVITKFLELEHRKLLIIIAVILLVLFEIFLFVFVALDFNLIGVFYGPFDYQWGLYTTIYYLSSIAIVIISGIPFALKSIKSKQLEINLKGKFLLVGLISFIIGALIPYIFYYISALVVSRLILVTSSIELYVGFMLPRWVKELIIK